MSQHILDTAMHSSAVKVFVCGNKTDLQQDLEASGRCVDDEQVEDFLSSCGPSVSNLFKISCKTGAGVKEMFHCVASELYSKNFHRYEQPRTIKVKEEPSSTREKKKCC